MILFVSDTCPRCSIIKRMVNGNVEIINVTENEEYIDKYGLSSVPTLFDKGNLIINIQDIVTKLQGTGGID